MQGGVAPQFYTRRLFEMDFKKAASEAIQKKPQEQEGNKSNACP
jgi:hypothetical protein